MRRKLAALIAVQLVAAPASATGGMGSDGYRWGLAPPQNAEVLVRVVYHKNRRELLQSFVSAGGVFSLEDGQDKSGPLYAFSAVDRHKGTCTIHAVDPSRSYSPQYLGHELLHCLHGQWHPQQ